MVVKVRIVFLIMCFTAALAGSAQSKQIDKIRIPAAKVAKAADVASIFPDTLGKCTVTSYHFYANLGNTVKSMDVKSGEITPAVKTVVAALAPGEKFVIENIRYSCQGERKKSYVFIIQ